MATTSEGMSQRLARLRSASRTVTPVEVSKSEPTESKFPTASRDATKNQNNSDGRQFHICFDRLAVKEFDDVIEPSPGYRLFEGQIWLAVTPELLGWMSARIEQGLRSSVVTDDLGQAIDLFHRARDASGLEPVAVRGSWMPPGIELKAPPDVAW